MVQGVVCPGAGKGGKHDAPGGEGGKATRAKIPQTQGALVIWLGLDPRPKVWAKGVVSQTPSGRGQDTDPLKIA
jgi:hypothetical protein